MPGISAVPHEDNLRYFDVTIHGPSQSPYEGLSPALVIYNQSKHDSRGYFQVRIVPARRLSYDSTKDPLSDEDLPSEHR